MVEKLIQERQIEVPWVRKQLAKFDFASPLAICDYGCCYNPVPNETKLATDRYLPNNCRWKILGVDVREPSSFDHRFLNMDITEIQNNEYLYAAMQDTFNIALCVSTLEHIGLSSTYGGKVGDGLDLVALKNIVNTLAPDGTLLMTFPVAGISYKPKPWIRAYSEHDIERFKWGIRDIATFESMSLFENRYKLDGWEYVESYTKLSTYPHDDGIRAVACVAVKRKPAKD